MNIKKSVILLATIASQNVYAEEINNQEMYQMIMELKKEIFELQKENTSLKQSVEVVDETVNEMVEATDVAIKSYKDESTRYNWGGYGELHGNWLDDQLGASDTDTVDFHRFVLFYNYKFADNLKFFSELELEHSIAGEGKTGEVELEQAYLQYDLSDNTSLTGGLFLLPIGILNETHEPNTFYGVERNDVEKNIIPATWWEGGAMISHNIMDGLNLKLAAHTGLKATTTYRPRDGRQKVGNATAKDPAYTAALKYNAIPGVEIGASINFQDEFDQGSSSLSAGDAMLYEVHINIQKGDHGLRALYAEWDMQGSGPAITGRDEQFGWYIEPSYKINDKLGVFARYALWDNNAGSSSSSNTKYKQTNFGINYWVHPQVVLKADWQDQNNGAGISKELDGINLGLGYTF